MSSQHAEEIKTGNRFTFGENWTRFLGELDAEKLSRAENSLCQMLKVKDLHGKCFLDIGSGSGLFSLAARRLGATVHSFDYDPQSVACTKNLQQQYFPADPAWNVEHGSALDTAYLASLGQWDIVYSWGVLHHTGDMYQAFNNVASLVKQGGKLFIAIYNDQGRSSKLWLRVKQTYNWLPPSLRWLVLYPATLRLWGPTTVRDLAAGTPFRTWCNYSRRHLRGMSPWRDVVDWVGGLPFEVASPEQVFQFYRERGFQLAELKTCQGGHGCNEFVFRKD